MKRMKMMNDIYYILDIDDDDEFLKRKKQKKCKKTNLPLI